MPVAARRRGSISSVSWGSNKSSGPDDLDEYDLDGDNDLDAKYPNRWSDPSMKVDSPAGYYPPRYVDCSNDVDHGIIGNGILSSSPRSTSKFNNPLAPPPLPPSPSQRTGSPRLPIRTPPSPQKKQQQQQQRLSNNSFNQLRPRIRRLSSTNIPIENYGGCDATHDDEKCNGNRGGDAGISGSYLRDSHTHDSDSRFPPGRRGSYRRTDMTGTIHYISDDVVRPEHYQENNNNNNNNNNTSASSNLHYVSDDAYNDTTDFGDDTADENTMTNKTEDHPIHCHPEDLLPTKPPVNITSPVSDDMSSPKSEIKKRKEKRKSGRRRRFSLTSASSASPRKQERTIKGGFGALAALSPKSKKDGRWARFRFGNGGTKKNVPSNPMPSAPSLFDDSIATKSLIDDSINDVNFEYLLHHPSSMIARTNAAAKRRRKYKKRNFATDQTTATDKDKALCQPPRRRLSIPRSNKEEENIPKTSSQVDYSISVSISEESDIFSSDYDEFTISRPTLHDSYILPEPPEPPKEALEATGNKGDGDHGRRLIDLIQKLSIRAAMAMTRSNNRESKASRRKKPAKNDESQKQEEQHQQQTKTVKPRTSNTTASTYKTAKSSVSLESSHRRAVRT